MLAIAKTKRVFGSVEFIDAPKPEVQYGQVLIKIKATAICGSDLHVYESPPGYEFMKVPNILGHEYSGIVEAVGEGVTQFAVGDRVMAESNQFCGYCANCHEGRTHICVNNKMTGIHVDGGMAEYIAVPQVIVHKLPDKVSFEEASVAQPCAVSFHGVFDKSKIRPSDIVMVFGPGIVGLMAAQGAKIMGARHVIVVGTDADAAIRLPIATKMGFSVINGQQQDIKQELFNITGEKAADVAVECAGAIPAVNQALKIVRKGGAITFIGVYSKPAEIFITDLIRNEISLDTSYTCQWKNYEQALQLIASGQVDLSHVMNIYPFAKGIDAFEDALAKKVLKPVLTL